MRIKLPPMNLQQAKRKVMDLLARRDHTALELKKKLKDRCDESILSEVLDWAETQKWLPSAEKIQDQIVSQYGRRLKGQNAINKKLKEVGLAPVRLNAEEELKNATLAIETKWKPAAFKGLDFKTSQKEKARVIRFLASRGFNLDIAQKAFKNYFTNSSYEDNYE